MVIRRAYTLVELLITISVLSMLAVFTVPTYQMVLSQLQLGSAAESVADFIRLTEQRTVTEQKPFGITLTANATSIRQFVYNTANGQKTYPSDAALQTHVLPSNIIISQVNFSGASDIRFAASGAPNVSGNVVLTDTIRNRSRRVEIRPSGTVFANQGEFSL